MNTKYNSNDKVWIMGTIRTAFQLGGKNYYNVDECEEAWPEEKCRGFCEITKDFDKNKLKRSILDAYESERTDLRSSSAYYVDTIIEILKVIHDNELTVAEAEDLLQDTYTIMCLGAKF